MRKISDWSVKWEMSININKYQILRVGSRNIKNVYDMRGVRIKSVHSVKDLGVSVTSNLKFIQQCIASVIKAKMMKGLIKRILSFKNKDVLLPLCNSFVRPHLDPSMPSSFLVAPPCKTLLN